MLACVGPLDDVSPLLAAFRHEAARGKRLLERDGHRDGWGIVVGAEHVGRSPLDASDDPAYLDAAAHVAREGRGIALAHLRAASAGAKTVENTHPFVEDGLAFCHNGNIRGLAPEGESDSRAFFAAILTEVRAGLTPEDALVATARRIDKAHTHSSLTCFLTDGQTLWALRRVGTDPVECADRACAADYYTLGVARVGEVVVVTQEHEFVGRAHDWREVPDGHLVRLTLDGRVDVRSVM